MSRLTDLQIQVLRGEIPLVFDGFEWVTSTSEESNILKGEDKPEENTEDSYEEMGNA
jgi:hypothetical protein